MNYVSILEVLAWPVTVLIIAFTFRQNVSRSIDRLSSLNAGASGISIGFSEKIAKAKEQIRALKQQPQVMAKSNAELGRAPYQDMMSHWLKVKDDWKRFAQNEGLSVNRDQSTIDLLQELSNKGIIVLEEKEAFQIVHKLVEDSKPDMNEQQAQELKELMLQIQPK